MQIKFSDIFKIGIGPSSSHTMGPMIAAHRFLKDVTCLPKDVMSRLQVKLYGSLALTGKGHATDKAVILGLLGYEPESLEPEHCGPLIEAVYKNQTLTSPILSSFNLPSLNFSPEQDLIFAYGQSLPEHPNALTFTALDKNDIVLFEKTYFSIGGGFVLDEHEIKIKTGEHDQLDIKYPYHFKTASEMLQMGQTNTLTISEMMQENELIDISKKDLENKLDQIWSVMNKTIERGLQTEGELPGGLKVKRRAKKIYNKLKEERFSNSAPNYAVNEWLSVFAMAVNEENAAGGQIVTAPTNGAAGVIPSVIRYYQDFCPGSSREGIHIFLLTAAAIGSLIKHNASISGAEVGCQGEVGSASAMAAAGLCAALGGSNTQIENAAEIALEHHLGMTCDPIKGLVQVPCIERNGLGAVKAVTATSLALRGDGTHIVSLDHCIQTMRQTGLDMSSKYKETSLGGLAVNIPEC